MPPPPPLPDPACLRLPWGETGEAWYDGVDVALRGLFRRQRLGRFARGSEPRPRPRWKALPLKGLRKVRAHEPLFRVQRSVPGFQTPSAEALRELASRPILEVGAGSGAFALLVAAAGGDVVATDPRPWPMGASYDHRDKPWDRTFAQRQRASRSRAAVPGDRLLKPYAGVFDGPGPRHGLGRGGPARMKFPATLRPAMRLARRPCFAPVLVMDAAEAVGAFPGRDVLLLSPDPMRERWAHDLLDSLPTGSRVYHLDDFGSIRRVPRGYRQLGAFEVRSLSGHLEAVRLIEKV